MIILSKKHTIFFAIQLLISTSAIMSMKRQLDTTVEFHANKSQKTIVQENPHYYCGVRITLEANPAVKTAFYVGDDMRKNSLFPIEFDEPAFSFLIKTNPPTKKDIQALEVSLKKTNPNLTKEEFSKITSAYNSPYRPIIMPSSRITFDPDQDEDSQFEYKYSQYVLGKSAQPHIRNCLRDFDKNPSVLTANNSGGDLLTHEVVINGPKGLDHGKNRWVAPEGMF